MKNIVNRKFNVTKILIDFPRFLRTLLTCEFSPQTVPCVSIRGPARLNFSMVSNNIACFRDKLLISCAMQYFHVYFNDTIYPVSYIASNVKHMEMIGRNDGEKFYNDCEMDKQSWKWGEKKSGWEFSLENAKSLVQRVEEV